MQRRRVQQASLSLPNGRSMRTHVPSLKCSGTSKVRPHSLVTAEATTQAYCAVCVCKFDRCLTAEVSSSDRGFCSLPEVGSGPQGRTQQCMF